MNPYASLVDRAAVPMVNIKHGEKRAHNQPQAVVLREYGVISYRQEPQQVKGEPVPTACGRVALMTAARHGITP